MTSRNQIGSDDNVLLQLITEKKREKEESLAMLCEFEKQVRAKMQLEKKINDLQVELQRENDESLEMFWEYHKKKVNGLQGNLQEDAMREPSLLGMILQSTGTEELMLKLQGKLALADQLTTEVVAKQKLETIIEESKGKWLVENDMKAEQEELQARNDDLEELNKTLIIKELHTNDELVEARKQLLRAFLSMPGGETSIGIKKMGEVDIGPFKKMLEEKLIPEAELKAARLCSYWQGRVRDASWHPFRIVIHDDGTDHKEVIDENDESLKRLKEMGDEVYEAVTNALKQLNEYNPSGRYVVPEIWNFKENRRAKTGEAIAYMANQLNMLKHKRSRGST